MKNSELVSGCGLYCGSCGIYIATQEHDTEKILHYAVVLNQTFEDTLCDGCGAERKSLHCTGMCEFIACKKRKGVDFCFDCHEFPCDALLDFRAKMPHRAGIIESQIRLKEGGIEKWLTEMKNDSACPQCKTINSAYQLTCRNCGNMPGSSFAGNHRALIEKFQSDS